MSHRRSGNANDLGEVQSHFAGHESTKMEQPEVVAIGSFEHVLRCIETGNRKAVLPVSRESDLL